MRHAAFVITCVALLIELVVLGALGLQVLELRHDLELARAVATRPVSPAYPLTVDGHDPSVTFEDEAALADYLVRTRAKLDALEAAMERDIHTAADEGGQRVLPYTHAMIDGKPKVAAGETSTGPYLTYPAP